MLIHDARGQGIFSRGIMFMVNISVLTSEELRVFWDRTSLFETIQI